MTPHTLAARRPSTSADGTSDTATAYSPRRSYGVVSASSVAGSSIIGNVISSSFARPSLCLHDKARVAGAWMT